MEVRHFTREDIESIAFDEKEELIARSHTLAEEAFGAFMEKEDVKNHVTDIDLLVICSDNNEFVSFGSFHIFDIDGYIVMHLYGICVNPTFQGSGLFGVIWEYAKKIINPDIISSRTQSPRLYKAFMKGVGSNPVYPGWGYEISSEAKRAAELIIKHLESGKNYIREEMLFKDGYSKCLYAEIPFLADDSGNNEENREINNLFRGKLAIDDKQSRDAIFLISFMSK